MKVVIVSAHPDDAETAAGGLIATAVKADYEVVILHGGPAVKGLEYEGRLSWDVRTEESTAAADILGARVEFFNWGHSEFEFNRNNLNRLGDFLDSFFHHYIRRFLLSILNTIHFCFYPFPCHFFRYFPIRSASILILPPTFKEASNVF